MEHASIRSEPTPNPNSRRYLVDRPIQEHPKGRFFTSADATEEPLVKLLFELEGVASVMLLPGSVTIGKTPTAAWDTLEERIEETIERFFT